MFGKFLSAAVSIIEGKDGTKELVDSLKQLAATDILIGIPEQTAERDTSEINNATLALILERGNPINNTPPRPFLMPAIEADIDKIVALQNRAWEAATNGQDITAPVERIGLLGQRLVQDWFTDSRNGWPPNAPSTIAAKGSDQPNIDTAALRKSITYVVRTGN